MLNCILGMVDKTKRALSILQHRSIENAVNIWTSGGGSSSSSGHRRLGYPNPGSQTVPNSNQQQQQSLTPIITSSPHLRKAATGAGVVMRDSQEHQHQALLQSGSLSLPGVHYSKVERELLLQERVSAAAAEPPTPVVSNSSSLRISRTTNSSLGNTSILLVL